MPLIRKDPASRTEPVHVDLRAAESALRGGTAEERWNAARSLGVEPGAARLLGDALGREADARVREALFTSLTRLANPESVEAVIRHLRSDDSALRTGALDALRDMIAAVRPRLPALLADSDPDIRVLCCELVRELPAADATDLLCPVLERDGEPNVCAAAVDVLAEIGQPAALPFLDKCAARFRDQSFLSFSIRIAAERIASQRLLNG
jgi:HEAT repeat protein